MARGRARWCGMSGSGGLVPELRWVRLSAECDCERHSGRSSDHASRCASGDSSEGASGSTATGTSAGDSVPDSVGDSGRDSGRDCGAHHSAQERARWFAREGPRVHHGGHGSFATVSPRSGSSPPPESDCGGRPPLSPPAGVVARPGPADEWPAGSVPRCRRPPGPARRRSAAGAVRAPPGCPGRVVGVGVNPVHDKPLVRVAGFSTPPGFSTDHGPASRPVRESRQGC